jgi:hypothetical protein
MLNDSTNQIKGLFLIIDRGSHRGLVHWSDELERRDIPAVILMDEYTVNNYCNLVKDISEKSFDLGCSFNKRPFWDETYGSQYEIMSRIKEKAESCMNQPMRIFGSKYFAYNENTLKSADKLGLDYLMARGTAGIRALVYKAEEYNARIISVSNVPSKELGTGSLCDESLWCRGETPASLMEILFHISVDSIIVVAQTHLSGVKLNWWNVYQEFLDKEIVVWQSIDEFVKEPIVLPNSQIPLNTTADYRVPKPKVPLEEEPDFPFE